MTITWSDRMWPASGSARIAREERMLDERRRKERERRECAPPAGALAPSFLAGGQVITPGAPISDACGFFLTVLVDGRRWSLFGDIDGTMEAFLDEPDNGSGDEDEYGDGLRNRVASRWLEFEYRVRIREPEATGAYGLMLAALVIAEEMSEQRANEAIDATDRVMNIVREQ